MPNVPDHGSMTDDNEMTGRIALVTGGNKGIGREIAGQLAQRGATVLLAARDKQRREDAVASLRAGGLDVHPVALDVTDPASAAAAAALIDREHGRLDVLVNNAGIPKRRHVTALDAATVDAVMNINYSSPVRLTLALLPQMLERGEGRILNISSVAATLSPPGEAAYAATKAAVTVFSESMAVDLWDTGVKVTVVYPGVVDTELFTLPDNDPFVAQVESITVDEAVTTIMQGLADEAAQVYVPAWFGDVASSKAANVEQFLAGTAEYVRQQGTNS